MKTIVLVLGFLAALSLRADPKPVGSPLNVSLLPLFSSSAVFIAKERGYFNKESLKVNFVTTGAAKNVARAVADGDADIGVTALTQGFYNLAEQNNLKIIAGQYQEKPGWKGSAYIACNNAYENGLTKPEQTIEHSMGVTQTGSSFHRWYGLLAQQQNSTLNDGQLIRLQSVKAMIDSLVHCQVNSTIMMSQVALPLERVKKAHILGWVSDYSPGQMGIVFTTKRALQEKRKSISRFLRAYKKASQDYFDTLITGHDQESRIKLLHEINRNLSPAVPDDMLNETIVYLDRNAWPNISSIENNLDWYRRQGMVNPDITLSKIIDLRLLKELAH